MPTVYEYLHEADPSPTIHLIKQGEQWHPPSLTLCGRWSGIRRWTLGDETTSGIAVTCVGCREALEKEKNERT